MKNYELKIKLRNITAKVVLVETALIESFPAERSRPRSLGQYLINKKGRIKTERWLICLIILWQNIYLAVRGILANNIIFI